MPGQGALQMATFKIAHYIYPLNGVGGSLSTSSSIFVSSCQRDPHKAVSISHMPALGM